MTVPGRVNVAVSLPLPLPLPLPNYKYQVAIVTSRMESLITMVPLPGETQAKALLFTFQTEH
jgi:hypothetical protein